MRVVQNERLLLRAVRSGWRPEWNVLRAPGRLFENPDLILDRRHSFGGGLNDSGKRALIETVKTF
jgi:hypothetical protein